MEKQKLWPKVAPGRGGYGFWVVSYAPWLGGLVLMPHAGLGHAGASFCPTAALLTSAAVHEDRAEGDSAGADV